MWYYQDKLYRADSMCIAVGLHLLERLVLPGARLAAYSFLQVFHLQFPP